MHLEPALAGGGTLGIVSGRFTVPCPPYIRYNGLT
jgi:hypothetical protein